jgi:hypothetical protein
LLIVVLCYFDYLTLLWFLSSDVMTSNSIAERSFLMSFCKLSEKFCDLIFVFVTFLAYLKQFSTKVIVGNNKLFILAYYRHGAIFLSIDFVAFL